MPKRVGTIRSARRLEVRPFRDVRPSPWVRSALEAWNAFLRSPRGVRAVPSRPRRHRIGMGRIRSRFVSSTVARRLSVLCVPVRSRNATAMKSAASAGGRMTAKTTRTRRPYATARTKTSRWTRHGGILPTSAIITKRRRRDARAFSPSVTSGARQPSHDTTLCYRRRTPAAYIRASPAIGLAPRGDPHASPRVGRLERLHRRIDGVDRLLASPKSITSSVEIQRVVDAGEAGLHRTFEHDDVVRVIDVEDRHAVDW